MVRTAFLGLVSLWLVASIIISPDEAFQAALQGLTIWWDIVFPGLLPFLVLAELMVAFGVVHALGALLEPLVRRLLGLPGSAAWALALGWTAGYTTGAEAAARLRTKREISRSDGQWLLAVAHMPSPMLMFIVIGAGFLHQPLYGLFIAGAVWISALLFGLVLRLFPGHRKETESGACPPSAGSNATAYSSPMEALAAGRAEDGRSFGQVLGEAVTLSVQKLMTIGGFMIVWALFARLLQLTLPEKWALFAFPGLYEAHLGVYSASEQAAFWGMPAALALICAVLSFSGFSSLILARSAFAGSDLRFAPFLAARIGHALLAFATALLLWTPFHKALAYWPFAGTSTVAAVWHGALAPPALGFSRLPSLWTYVPLALGALAATLFIGMLANWVLRLSTDRQRL
ncbi:nucleoside recognition domain-containing protein [Paenibacillaceae bacterium]|nr:nucleoside recognition domain-containing protein [Paenibacillaceae bacterium]